MTSKCQQLVATGLEIRSKSLATYSSMSQIDLDSYVNVIQTLKMAVSCTRCYDIAYLARISQWPFIYIATVPIQPSQGLSISPFSITVARKNNVFLHKTDKLG